jgi:hypothetical protein
MKSHAIGLAILALAATPPAQSTRLDLVPIVGHWEQQTIDQETIVTADATKWDRKPVADPMAVARRLFAEPTARFAANASSPGAFPLAIVRAIESFTAGTARVQVKLIAGASDQLAGLVFDLRPNGEYHALRYNTKDGNVALWKYVDGARARVAEGTDHVQLPLDVWHTIELTVADRKVTGVVNGRLRLAHTLDRPVAGRVGFWAKPDSVSAFKGLQVQN